jgi:MFS transporter, DHA2 family, multidrug resistance protein
MSHRSDAAGAQTALPSTAPARAGIVLASLIAVAAVANLNLSVANVALPSIGRAFDSSQTMLDLIAVGYSLGLAGSVLYLGAVGDRYGRKLMLLLGMVLSVPACILAAYAPSDTVLFAARVLGGLSAGLAYPTTLALIAALWSGPGRTKSIALWSALGGGIAALGPLVAGGLLEQFWWGSVFLVTLPLAVVALLMAWFFVPSHVNETTDPVDNFGGVLSVVLVGTLILAINFAPVPNKGTLAIGLGVITLVTLVGFVIRQRRAANPLYDLHVAGRRIFWVAAVAGIIVFGSLMGSAFVSQQYLQNVLGYSTFHAGAAFLPAVIFMVLVAPRSAKLVDQRGARFTLLVGYVSLILAFGSMLLLWKENTPYWQVGLAYALIGIGVGLAGTPASHSLTGSVPVTRAGMASGTADLQRDLGGAIMQSVFGALLTAGYATAFSAKIASSPNASNVSVSVQNQLTKSFSSASDLAQQYPQYSSQIIAAARSSFLSGDQWAYTAGIIAIVIGFVLVFFMFPRKADEDRLLAAYHVEDTSRRAAGEDAGGVKVAAAQILDDSVEGTAADPDRAGPRRAEGEQERQVQAQDDGDPADEQRAPGT